MGNNITSLSKDHILYGLIEDTSILENGNTARFEGCRKGLVWKNRKAFIDYPRGDERTKINDNAKRDLVVRSQILCEQNGYTNSSTGAGGFGRRDEGSGLCIPSELLQNLNECYLVNENICNRSNIDLRKTSFNTEITRRITTEIARRQLEAAEAQRRTAITTEEAAGKVLTQGISQLELDQQSSLRANISRINNLSREDLVISESKVEEIRSINNSLNLESTKKQLDAALEFINELRETVNNLSILYAVSYETDIKMEELRNNNTNALTSRNKIIRLSNVIGEGLENVKRILENRDLDPPIPDINKTIKEKQVLGEQEVDPEIEPEIELEVEPEMSRMIQEETVTGGGNMILIIVVVVVLIVVVLLVKS